ncbi:extracellular solute-binding protein family 1 [Gloeothece citriformis PCC 7424]|uniref:Extracellular solute-binding protein family 1 n=1 Tax=Gloeothece citriformis (strain PCC 7424) TaxID=65393 RepID=B7KH39_GLOC7|nr:Fe(3+) ABC transporter substrate-binding protein [Gloeothece citriformis]ACK69248.1 extracellular solute-binding protein family 1 [Gloeothece citriformis PCC 7424]
MNKITRRVFIGAGAATTAVVASQLSKLTIITAQTRELNLYSSRHYNTDRRLYDNFTKQTGIKVNLVEAEADPLIERIKSEGRNSPADILITVDAGRLWRAQQEGIFAPVNSRILQQKIPSYLREPKGHWYGFSKRLRVIMYNKKRVNPSQLSSYDDLINPRWRSKVVSRSSSNIYSQSFTAWLVATRGEAAAEKWCRGLVGNFARPPQGNDKAQIEAVAAGMADLALANTYYLAGYASDKDPAKRAIYEQVGVFFPTGRGAHVNISGAGLIKTAPNREAAIKFLEYLATPEAQNFFAQGNNEYPVVEGITVTASLAKFGSYKSDVASVANYGPNLAKSVQVMNRAGWK